LTERKPVWVVRRLDKEGEKFYGFRKFRPLTHQGRIEKKNQRGGEEKKGEYKFLKKSFKFLMTKGNKTGGIDKKKSR